MCRRLCNRRYKNYVTTYEPCFDLDGNQGIRDISYVRSNGLPQKVKETQQNDLHSVAVMVWAGVSTHGKTQLHFIEHGATITSRFYIEHIIKPFIQHDIPRFFPGGTEKMVLRHENVSGHKAKETLAYMKEHKIQVITLDEWSPKSPDAALMDYSIGEILKEQV